MAPPDKRRAGHQAADWQDLSPPLQSHDMPHRRQDRARHLHRHRGEAPEFWLLCPAAHKTVKTNGPTLPGDGQATGASLTVPFRSEEHTSEHQSLMRISNAVF